MKQINLENALDTREYDILGEVFTVDLSDEGLVRLQGVIKTLEHNNKTLTKSNISVETYRDSLIHVANSTFIEENAGETIYNLVNKSTVNLSTVLYQVFSDLRTLIDKAVESRIEQYLV